MGIGRERKRDVGRTEFEAHKATGGMRDATASVKASHSA